MKFKSTILVVCLFAFSSVVPLCRADEMIFKKNNPDIMKYDFSRSYIASFSYLHSLDIRLDEAKTAKSKGTGLDFIQWNLDRLGKDNMDLRIAKNYVSKYFSVPNPLMRKVIDTYAYSCDQLIELNLQERSLWNQMYESSKNETVSPEQDQEFVKNQGELAAKRQEAMRSILESSVLLTKLMLSENMKEKQVKKRLALTSKERDRLIRKLDTYAGDNLDWGMKPGQTYLQGAVATIREVLEDPTFLSADD